MLHYQDTSLPLYETGRDLSGVQGEPCTKTLYSLSGVQGETIQLPDRNQIFSKNRISHKLYLFVL
ncbi:MAG TPA: hypothetical protein ENG03_13175 [Thioploca sp.]|nr:MAG: hypothetical protein DRR19_20680 [Gammaproteobacteria bacterium]HDN28013.1 hypothetical protein [Thioploca sp.]